MAILAVGAMALSLPGLAYAADANQPPERMTYQGYLVDGDGNALAATAPANFKNNPHRPFDRPVLHNRRA